MDQQLLSLILRGIAKQLRTRPDKRHIALDNVKKLRDLVELGLAQNIADLCDAAVVQRRRSAADLIRVLDHGTELKDAEGLVPITAPLRAIENRQTRVDHNGKR